MQHLLSIIGSLAVGALIPVQAAANIRLGHMLGHSLLGAFVSLVIAALALALVVTSLQLSPGPVRALIEGPWWAWIGGLVGAGFIGAGVIVVPRVGATTFLTAIIAGQLTASLLIDRMGWLGVPARQTDVWRISGVVLVAAGVLSIWIGSATQSHGQHPQ